MRNKGSLWAIIPGIIFLFVYGWEVFAGSATTKDWASFIGGIALLVVGLLLLFGVIKDISNKTPREEYLMLFGCCIGWGVCAVFGWFVRDCAFDHNTITFILVLVFLVIATFKTKRNLPKK